MFFLFFSPNDAKIKNHFSETNPTQLPNRPNQKKMASKQKQTCTQCHFRFWPDQPDYFLCAKCFELMKQQAAQQARKTGLPGPVLERYKAKPISWLQHYMKQAQPAWLKRKKQKAYEAKIKLEYQQQYEKEWLKEYEFYDQIDKWQVEEKQDVAKRSYFESMMLYYTHKFGSIYSPSKSRLFEPRLFQLIYKIYEEQKAVQLVEWMEEKTAYTWSTMTIPGQVVQHLCYGLDQKKHEQFDFTMDQIISKVQTFLRYELKCAPLYLKHDKKVLYFQGSGGWFPSSAESYERFRLVTIRQVGLDIILCLKCAGLGSTKYRMEGLTLDID